MSIYTKCWVWLEEGVVVGFTTHKTDESQVYMDRDDPLVVAYVDSINV